MMKKSVLIQILFLVIGIFTSVHQASASDDRCSGFPPFCKHIRYCIENDKLNSIQAVNCYERGYIDEKECDSLYEHQGKYGCKYVVECLRGCSYPPMCQKLEQCIVKCHGNPHGAKDCYKAGYIDKAECDKYYGNCELSDHERACEDKCGNMGVTCKNVDFCSNSCGLQKRFVEWCYEHGLTSLSDCKKHSNNCHK